MRLFLSVLAMILSGAAPALAIDPSFDCDKAAAPLEYTICGDAELRRLDAALGGLFKERRAMLPEAKKAAFVQEQRDWARARLQKCAIPASIDRPMTEPERWLWAPCLADVYRVRLAALGQPDVPPEHAAPQDQPGFLHPLCLVRAVGLPMEESGEDSLPAVPLAACNRGFRHVPVLRDKDSQTAAGLSDHFEEFHVTLLPPVPLPGGDEAMVMRAKLAGLPGDFSAVYRLSRRNGQLTGRALVAGGETCHGGIFGDVAVVNGKLRVASAVDALRFLGYGATAALPETATAGLEDCPTCCYGYAETDYPLTPGGEAVFVSATVGHYPRESTVPQQQCLDRLATRPGGDVSAVHSFSATDLRRLTARYLQDCIAAAPVAPQATGLDCARPGTPLQHLVCGDRELVRLHGNLETLVAQQRGMLPTAQRAAFDHEQQAWTANHRDCGIAATGGKPDLRQRWDWAPCLAARYRMRVTALGLPEPTPEPFKIIHPMCVLAAAGGVTGKPEAVPLADCNHGYSHMAAVQDGTLISLPGTEEGAPAIDYRRIASLPDGASAVLLQFGDGDRQRSSVWSMTVANGVLTGGKLIDGGDNCRGGIFNVTVAGGRLQVESNATPAGLIGATSGLPDCPTCCYATILRDHPVTGGAGTLASASLAPLAADSPLAEAKGAMACLNRLTDSTRPRRMDAAALADLQARFDRDCRAGR